jgi:transposase
VTVVAFLEANQDKIEICRLPPYCSDLNLIERLWGHLKRTVLANVLYKTLDDLVSAFHKGVRRATVKRERMGFVFDRDDLLAGITHETKQKSA